MKNWTVMIYMASNNNLAEESIWAITEIQKLASLNDEVDIVVHLNTPGNSRLLFNLSTESNGKRRRELKSKSLFTAQDLKNFIIQTAKAHPANNFMLVLSGHGSGGVVDFLKQGDPPRVPVRPRRHPHGAGLRARRAPRCARRPPARGGVVPPHRGGPQPTHPARRRPRFRQGWRRRRGRLPVAFSARDPAG